MSRKSSVHYIIAVMVKSILKIKTHCQNDMITGARHLVNLLINNGVEVIFGYPGTPILGIYNELSKTDKIKHILTRHEQGAIHAAEGYARLKNKCGVVLVTSGPGMTNTITGLVNAYTDGTPLVVITGITETSGQNEFQDIDLIKLTQSCTKNIFIPNNLCDVERAVNSAFAAAMKYPQGPCVIGITRSLQDALIQDKPYHKLPDEIKVDVSHSRILKSIDMLKNAKTPLIIAGGGCKNAKYELSEFINLTHIPVVNTLMGTGVCDSHTSGMIGTNGGLNNSIKSADVVLALGVRFTDRTTNYENNFLPKSKIINVNVIPNTSKNVSPVDEIIGETEIVLRHMIGVIKSKNMLFDIKYDWIDKLSQVNNFSNRILNKIYEYAKKYHPIITTDTGEHQIETVKIFKTEHFITSGGMGAMGFGLPAAIGAYFARPDLPILNITGDGSFQMNIQELGTIARYNIPIKIIIMNNSSLGMIKTLQKEKYKTVFQSELINPDFAKIAQAYGIEGYCIDSESKLNAVLKQMFTYKKAVVLDIKTSGSKKKYF